MTPTPQQKQQLQAYAALIRQWNPKINLVAPATLKTLESRHIADSAQLLEYIDVSTPQTIADIGCGAGLPGIVLAILAPQHHITLVERDQRKAAFLHTAVHALGLKNTRVMAQDVAQICDNMPGVFSIITCRAWTNLNDILNKTYPLLTSQGQWLLLKGRAVDEELKGCETPFHFTKEIWSSKVDSGEGEKGFVLRITPAVSCEGETSNVSSTGNA